MRNSAIEAASAMRRIQMWSSERSSSSAATLNSGRNVMTVSKMRLSSHASAPSRSPSSSKNVKPTAPMTTQVA